MPVQCDAGRQVCYYQHILQFTRLHCVRHNKGKQAGIDLHEIHISLLHFFKIKASNHLSASYANVWLVLRDHFSTAIHKFSDTFIFFIHTCTDVWGFKQWSVTISLLTYDTLQSSRQLLIFLRYFQIQGEDGSSMCLLKHWLTTHQLFCIITQKTTV